MTEVRDDYGMLGMELRFSIVEAVNVDAGSNILHLALLVDLLLCSCKEKMESRGGGGSSGLLVVLVAC